MNDQILIKLTETMDDVKEKVIRIEEAVKDIGSLKSDVGTLKISQSKTDESTKSAHKRLDELEKKVGNVLFWGATTVIGGFIIGVIGLLFYLVKKGMA